jgi:hypothetical protein
MTRCAGEGRTSSSSFTTICSTPPHLEALGGCCSLPSLRDPGNCAAIPAARKTGQLLNGRLDPTCQPLKEQSCSRRGPTRSLDMTGGLDELICALKDSKHIPRTPIRLLQDDTLSAAQPPCAIAAAGRSWQTKKTCTQRPGPANQPAAAPMP